MRLLSKRSLRKRLVSLEDYLGVFFVNEDYPEHKGEEDGYGELQQLKKRIKALEDKQPKVKGQK